jgi:dTDP-4-amino-4,6-dideoxygalactose transaminase
LSGEVAFCDLRAAYLARASTTEAALLRVARSGRYVLGVEVDSFEAELAAVCGTPHAVGVGSGTDAIALALRAGGVGAGDEVIVPAYTAAATWTAVVQAGARPVGVDTDPASGLIDPEAAAAAVGRRTAALVPVHLFGRLAPMSALRRLADRHRLLLVVDAAHAAGVAGEDGSAAALADAAAFSFYPTKTLGGLGDGGAVVTANEDLAVAVRRLRSYGWADWQGQIPAPGINSRLDELQAAVLRERLRELPSIHARLRELGAGYRGALRGCRDLSLPAAPPGAEPPWHQFAVAHPDRDALRDALAKRGVGTALHYDPIPPQLDTFGQTGRFPTAESLASRTLSLPFDPWLTDAQAGLVCAAVVASSGSCERSRTRSPGS